MNFTQELFTFLGQPERATTLSKYFAVLKSFHDLAQEKGKEFAPGSMSATDSKQKLTQAGLQMRWDESLKWYFRIYSTVLKGTNLLSTQSLKDLPAWQGFTPLLEESLKIIESSSSMVRAGGFSFKRIDELIDRTYAALLEDPDRPRPGRLKAQTLKDTIKRFVLRFLMDDLSSSNFESLPVRLSPELFSRLSREIRVLLEHQKRVNRIYSIRWGMGSAPNRSIPLNELHSQIARRSWNSELELRYDNSAQAPVDFLGATVSGILQWAAGHLLRTYGHSEGGGPSIGLEKFDLFTNDIWGLATELGFFDFRTVGRAKRSFWEGRLFTYPNNLNDQLELLELVDLFSQMLSGGFRQTQRVYHLSLDWGCHEGSSRTDPVVGLPYLRKDCLMQTFLDRWSEVFKNFPGWLSSSQRWNENVKTQILEAALYVGSVSERDDRSPLLNEATVEYSELRNTFVALHYVENLMLIYDLNQDGWLSQAELEAAAPRFRDYISEKIQLVLKRIAQERPAWIRRILGSVGSLQTFNDTVFFYIAHRGRVPTAEDWGDFLSFTVNMARGALPNLDRTHILNVLKVLKQSSQESSSM
jgi:hypothetical protein